MGALHYNIDGHVVLPVSDFAQWTLEEFSKAVNSKLKQK